MFSLHILQRPGFTYALLGLCALLSLMMHLPHFNKDLVSVHVWRQTQTQSNIDNFYEEDMNLLNPRKNNRGNGEGIFRMEFPLMQWCIASIYHITGRQILITRIFMFLTGLLTVLGMFHLFRNLLKHDLAAAFTAFAFNFSPAFYYYTLNPLPDILALCFSVWGLALYYNRGSEPVRHLVYSLIFLSLGALCKLPFILYFIIPFSDICFRMLQHKFQKKHIRNLLFILFMGMTPLLWYIPALPQWKGNGIVEGLMNNEVPLRVLSDYFIHNLISTFPELLLNYAALPLFAAGVYFLFRDKIYRHRNFPGWVCGFILVCLYFFFELNMIGKVHDYYLFPFYPFIFLVTGYGILSLFKKNLNYKTVVLGLLMLLPVTAWLRMQVRWNEETPGFNPDLLKYKKELQAAVPDNALCVAGNDESGYIFFYYIHKKGWAFSKDEIDSLALQNYIQEGAEFLYSDSRNLDENPSVKPLLNEQVLEKGSIRIFRLKKPI